MLRGRKPKPTALRVLRGNPSRRPLNLDEPAPPPLVLDAVPAELIDPAARAEWERIAPGLVSCGQVTSVDRAVLLGYCFKYAQWLALEREAARHPYVVKTVGGNPIGNPALHLANRAFDLMIRAANELGLTPSSRPRVVAKPPAPAVSKWAGALP